MAVFVKKVSGQSGRDHVPNTVRGSGYSRPRSNSNGTVDFDSFGRVIRPLVSPIIGSVPSAGYSVASKIISGSGKVKRPKNFGGKISGKGILDLLKDLFSSSDSGSGYGSGSGSGSGLSSGSSEIPASVPDYLNADLARHYGMDAATAYSEALANTSHQREVKDLQAAGLNPVLSTRYGGASGVSGATVYAPGVEGVSSSGAVNAKEASILSGLASGVVGLVTGSSAKANATEKIVNALGDIVSSFTSSRE